ncbi:ABC-three component system middle component 2 [Vibrio cholerae]
MEQVKLKVPQIFNSDVELATRVALILSSMEGEKFDIDELVLLDYALLYSSEFNGPSNLHPAVPNHLAEIAQRRELLPNSLLFFIKKGLIDVRYDENGKSFCANENTNSFVSCLNSSYFIKIWERLSWLSENYDRIIQIPIMELRKGVSSST